MHTKPFFVVYVELTLNCMLLCFALGFIFELVIGVSVVICLIVITL